jgi:hypothetical protein
MNRFALLVIFLAASSLGAQQLLVLSGNKLTSIDASSPGSPLSAVTVSNLQGGEVLLGIDYRPANGALYGLGSNSNVYTIDPATGVATPVGGQLTLLLAGEHFGFDFNPTVDRIRITSDTGQNFRVHPDTGAIAGTDTPLAYPTGDPGFGQTPGVACSGYTNSVAGATSTILYDIDAARDVLVTQAPPNLGQLNTVGPLGVDTTGTAALDISGMSGVAYAALTSPGSAVIQSNLFTIDLTTGAATFIGTIGTSGKVRGLAVAPFSGVSQSGAPAPGCHGPLGIGVNSTATPGNAAFALTVFGAPPSAAGILFTTSVLLALPRIENGVMILVDVAVADAADFVVVASPWGTASLTFPILADPALVGATRFAQVGFPDACAPGGIVVSPALAVTVMP